MMAGQAAMEVRMPRTMVALGYCGADVVMLHHDNITTVPIAYVNDIRPHQRLLSDWNHADRSAVGVRVASCSGPHARRGPKQGR